MLPCGVNPQGKFKMTCLNPKRVKFHWERIINKKTGEIYPAKIASFRMKYNEIITPYDNFIPCGKCEGCRADKASDTAVKAYLESQNHTENCFLTLTYDNDHLPNPKSLIVRDLQLFWKSLRKKIKPKKIKYLACGEYGLRTRRPHYHCAIFGYWPEDAKPYKKNENGDVLYTSETISKIWGKGFIILGMLTYQSAAYIARYVYKKAYGNDILNLKPHQNKEFTTCSKRPGLARNWYFDKEKWNLLLRNNGVFVPTPNGAILKPIPKYLLNLWKTYDWQSYYQWQDKNKENQNKNIKQLLTTTDENYFRYTKKQAERKKKSLERLDKYRINNIDLS